MSYRRMIGSIRVGLNAAIGGILWCLAWSGAALLGFRLPPLQAVAWMLTTMGVFLLYPEMASARRRRRRAATLGWRRLGPGWPWIALALPLLLLTIVSLIALNAQLVSDRGPDRIPYPFAQARWGGLVLLVLSVVVAPLVEEMAFRGFIQGRITRRSGPVVGLAVSAALFAPVHMSRAWLLYFFAIGLFLGYARLATRSLWAPVVLHAAINGMLLCLPEAVVSSGALATPWIAALCVVAFAWATTAAIRAAGRATRARQQGASPPRPSWSASLYHHCSS